MVLKLYAKKILVVAVITILRFIIIYYLNKTNIWNVTFTFILDTVIITNKNFHANRIIP